jgi:cytochrome c oxidase assembly protein subunit 15
MSPNSHETLAPSRWLHLWAVWTVCATLVLLFLGAIVSSFRVGMADPVWPTMPWHLLFISWDEPSAGFLIEHSHRLAGYVVGLSAIVLAFGVWRYDARPAVRWLGAAALSGIIIQGLLGGFRVKLNALLGTDLAMIHGAFSQIVFSLLIALALLTSPGWMLGHSRPAGTLQRWAWLTTGILFAQIVLGAILRHTYSPLGQRGHLLLAFAAVAAVIWLVKLALDETGDRTPGAWAVFLAILMAAQVVLGIESWMVQFGNGRHPLTQAITAPQAAVRTAHVLVGYGIMATTVVVTLRSHRQMAGVTSLAAAGKLEGAA